MEGLYAEHATLVFLFGMHSVLFVMDRLFSDENIREDVIEMTEVIYPPCKKCGAVHGMGIETMATGHIEPLDLCYRCMWEPLKFNYITDQIDFNDTTGLQKLMQSAEKIITK